MGASDEPKKDKQEEPEHSDDTLEWLDELIGKESEEDKKPAIDADELGPGAESSGEAGIAEWLEADLESGAPDEQVLPEWLLTELSQDGPAVNEKPTAKLDADPEATIVAPRGAVVPNHEEQPGLESEVVESDADALGDEEADLSWLDQIATGEGAAIEESPTMSWDDVDDERRDSGEEEVEAGGVLSWLSELQGEEVSVESPDRPSSESREYTSDSVPIESMEPVSELPIQPDHSEDLTIDLSAELPEDPDDAMAWLEHLAARQGTPLEELPSMAGKDQDERSDEQIYDEAISDIRDIDETAWPVDAETMISGVDVETSEVPDDPDEAMAWLERLAAQQGAPIEELPSLDEGMTQLVEAADVEPEFSEEEEEFVTKLPDGELAEEMEFPSEEADVEPEFGDEFEEALTEPADVEVMEEGKVPAVVGEVEPVPGEQLEEFIAEMPEVEALEEVDLLADFKEAEADEELAGVLAELSDIELPESEEQALSWLQELAVSRRPDTAEEPIFAIEDVVEEPATPAMPHDIVEARAEAETLLARQELMASEDQIKEEAIDEEEDALAWLEQLADKRSEAATVIVEQESDEATEESVQIEPGEEEEAELVFGDDLEKLFELPVEDMSKEEPKLEDVYKPPLGVPVEDKPGEEVFEESAPDIFEQEEYLEASQAVIGEVEIQEPALEAQVLFDDTEQDETPSGIDDIEQALSAEEADTPLEVPIVDRGAMEVGEASAQKVEEPEDDDLEWLDTLGDMDVTGWLRSEEAARLEQADEDDLATETVSTPEELKVPEPVLENADVQPLVAMPDGIDLERLEAGRSAAEMGDLYSAISEYIELINDGEGLPFLIADLESWIEQHGDEPKLIRTLGDAYAKNGQLQMALSTYRQALIQL